ncbi:MAG: CPBP family intramembrane metalloprotease [Archangiaceae bacterium]|nr:CPBP family intramembrane metalloprotease [Archangiaceae bacterium]
MTEPGATLWRDATGRVRWGWVVLAFTLTAVAVALGLHGVIYLLALGPHPPYRLDDPRLFFGASANLLSGLAATFAARWLGQDAGFQRPRLVVVGLVSAALLLTLSVGISAAVTGAVGISTCSQRAWLGLRQLVCLGPTAFGEELWLRGAALKAASRGLHPLFAIGGTALVFGGLHLTNPDASLTAALNVALVGVWFGALAWRFDSIWPAIGAHLAWNWFEGFVWGQNVSGIQAGCSLLTASAHGPFFSGGGFGPEASGVTTVCLAAAALVTAVGAGQRRERAGAVGGTGAES